MNVDSTWGLISLVKKVLLSKKEEFFSPVSYISNEPSVEGWGGGVGGILVLEFSRGCVGRRRHHSYFKLTYASTIAHFLYAFLNLLQKSMFVKYL